MNVTVSNPLKAPVFPKVRRQGDSRPARNAALRDFGPIHWQLANTSEIQIAPTGKAAEFADRTACFRLTVARVTFTIELPEADLERLCAKQGLFAEAPVQPLLIEAAFDSLLTHLEDRFDTDILIEPTTEPDPMVRWFLVSSGALSFPVRFGCADACLPGFALWMKKLAPPWSRLRAIALPVAIHLGQFKTDFETLQILAQGDILLPAVGAFDLQAVELRIAGQRAGTGLIEHKNVTLEEVFPMDDWQPGQFETDDAAEMEFEAPNDLPINVSFEIGMRSMPLGEVASLGAGMVLPLAEEVDACVVSVRANGIRVAKARIVMVGERVALEITEVPADA